MREFIYLEECNSTNSFLSNLLADNSTEKSYVVTSAFQSSGQGQGDAFWESEKGKNLTFSYNLVNMDIKAVNQFYISIIISLSIADLIESYLPSETVKIKWPNDIYIHDKKLAGILVENSVLGDKIVASNIGIGININQQKFESNAPNPVSVIHYYNKQLDVKEVLFSYLKSFDNYYALLQNGEFNILKSMYLDKLYRINKVGKYQINDEIIEGEIKGIDEFGFLSLMINNKLKSFDIKQVKYL